MSTEPEVWQHADGRWVVSVEDRPDQHLDVATLYQEHLALLVKVAEEQKDGEEGISFRILHARMIAEMFIDYATEMEVIDRRGNPHYVKLCQQNSDGEWIPLKPYGMGQFTGQVIDDFVEYCQQE